MERDKLAHLRFQDDDEGRMTDWGDDDEGG